ncbi:MAG: hypothetical protein LBB84_08375 [Tannerellaceae bacterium]|nr:hypothetical protein [Tannerellaceae bacterium]
MISVLPPQLPVGTYSLHIVTRYAGGATPLKDPRRIDYATPLTVVGDEGDGSEETPSEPPRED